MKAFKKALAASLAVTIIFAAALSVYEQNTISDKIIRLHVVGASDSAEDQYKKLAVRDAVLCAVEKRISGASGITEAHAELSSMLGVLTDISEETSGQTAELTLGREEFPTRSYNTFALPAGEYTSLRIVLGDGEGRNWWCVVYPPVCASAYELNAGEDFSDGEVHILTDGTPDVIISFRILELVSKIRVMFST